MNYREDENHNLICNDGKIIPSEKRTKCEVYSRVVGYLRPLSQYNKGKQEEFRLRKTFTPNKEDMLSNKYSE
jgi:anaerobic ribonucleoside-triphosphate reductase